MVKAASSLQMIGMIGMIGIVCIDYLLASWVCSKGREYLHNGTTGCNITHTTCS